MKVYLIRSPFRKSFSSGGTGSHFWKMGKIWNSLGSLKNHLNLGFTRKYGNNKCITLNFTEYLECELVILDAEDLTITVDSDFLKDFLRKKAIQLETEDPSYPLDDKTKKLLNL